MLFVYGSVREEVCTKYLSFYKTNSLDVVDFSYTMCEVSEMCVQLFAVTFLEVAGQI